MGSMGLVPLLPLTIIWIHISVGCLVQGGSSLTTISGAGRSSYVLAVCFAGSAPGLQLLSHIIQFTRVGPILQVIDGIEMMFVDDGGREVELYVRG